MKLEMTVNNKPISIDVSPNAFFADVLREQLGLTGTKIGCNEAECGICTVHRRWAIRRFVHLSRR